MSSLFFFFLLLGSSFSNEIKQSPTEGKLEYFKSYVNGKSMVSCRDCHNVVEKKLHRLHVPASYEEMRYMLDSFRSKGVTQKEGSCRRCHKVDPVHFMHRGRLTPQLHRWFLKKESFREERFKNVEKRCMSCHSLDEKHYSRVVRPGPPLENMYYRKKFKDGVYQKIEDAILDCMQRYQLRYEVDAAGHLASFIRTLSYPEENENYPYPVTPNRLPHELNANILSGKTVHDFSCAPCHKKFDITLKENLLSREFIFRKVRGMEDLPRRKALNEHPGVILRNLPDLKTPEEIPQVPAPQMPVFREDRLSDQYLKDVAEFLVQRQRHKY